jgi:predicted DsbA family dithiol-disulfide isomerase
MTTTEETLIDRELIIPLNQLRVKSEPVTYFEQGRLMSDHEVLVICATEVGLDETATREVLASGAYADEVRFDEAQARDNDFSAVPTFVVDGRFAVSGAQDPEVLMKMIERARATA